MERLVTHGQVLLARSYAAELAEELQLAVWQTEGEPCREAHIREARKKLDRLSELLLAAESEAA